MDTMDLVRSFFIIGHFVGLAAIVGPFLLQLRWKGQYAFPLVFGGAITQLVTGLVLVGLAEMRDVDIDYAKIGVKLVIGVVIFGAALLGFLKQRKATGGGGRELLPYFHAAGGLALINMTLAVFW